MIIEFLKDGKKMLRNKIIFNSNVANSINFLNTSSSAIPNTLFQLMQSNILIVNLQEPITQQDNQKEINTPAK